MVDTKQGAMPEIHSMPPELFHYTDLAGLTGIWQSQNLRARRFNLLNDHTELGIASAFMTAMLEPRLAAIHEEFLKGDRFGIKPEFQDRPLHELAVQEARDFIRTLHDQAFAERAMFIPYMVSLSGHLPGSYEAENGQLSQWRGYSGKAGYCIVFDADMLREMLNVEFDSWAYSFRNCPANALYAKPDFQLETVNPEFEGLLDNAYRRSVEGDASGLQSLVWPFVLACCSVKHQAFKEEAEVRLLSFPHSPEQLAKLQAFPDYNDARPQKPFLPDEESAEYIELLEGLGGLPITRIIVGPGDDQKSWYADARKVVGDAVKMTSSSTPLRTRR